MHPHDDSSDADLTAWLDTLGVTTRAQWDVLVFLYRHQVSLVGAHLIAHLLGYADAPTVAALDALALLGLVECSRVSQAARLYRFTGPADPPQRNAWTRLLAATNGRAGRVRLARHLHSGDQTAQAERGEARRLLSEAQQSVEASRQGLQATRRSLAEAQQSIQASRRRLHPESRGEDSWRTAI